MFSFVFTVGYLRLPPIPCNFLIFLACSISGVYSATVGLTKCQGTEKLVRYVEGSLYRVLLHKFYYYGAKVYGSSRYRGLRYIEVR